MRFVPNKYYFTFGPHEPMAIIKPGETITTSTLDSSGYDPDGKKPDPNMFQSSDVTSFYEANPLTGPFFIEGAKQGDTLSVYIESIKITRDYATSRFPSGFGALNVEDRLTGPTGIGDPLPELSFVWKLDIKGMTASIDLPNSKLKRATIALHPFIGCIGTAPPYGQINNSLTPAQNGGNMDCIETKPGTIVYLPVFVDGAYLMLGDIHAAQGDGEICGVALETTADVTLSVNLIKGKSIRWPRLEDDTHIMVSASARPLIDAFRIAHVEIIRWLVSDYGFDKWEAFQLLSQAGTTRIGNVVDPNYTVVAKFPKSLLPK